MEGSGGPGAPTYPPQREHPLLPRHPHEGIEHIAISTALARGKPGIRRSKKGGFWLKNADLGGVRGHRYLLESCGLTCHPLSCG